MLIFILSTYFNFHFQCSMIGPYCAGSFSISCPVFHIWKFKISKSWKMKIETLRRNLNIPKVYKFKIGNWNSGSWLAGCCRAGWVAGSPPLPASSIRLYGIMECSKSNPLGRQSIFCAWVKAQIRLMHILKESLNFVQAQIRLIHIL